MGDPSVYTYPSPLEGYEDAPPLPNEIAQDGKSYVNPPAEKLSEAYDKFIDPLDRGRQGGFDVHIYYLQTNEVQKKYASELWQRIRREFPELRIYRFWDKPIGPHPIAMFEVNIFTPAQFGAFISWLAIWRGPLSALIHPNVVPGEGVHPMAEAKRDHLERAIWMGDRLPLDLSAFNRRTEYQTITQPDIHHVEPVTITGDAVTSVETDVRIVVETVTEYRTEKTTETETKTRYTSTITCLDAAYTAKPPTIPKPVEERAVETPAAIPGGWPDAKVSLACSCLSVSAPKTTPTISETRMPTTIISTSTDVVLPVEEYTETVLSTSVSTYTSTITDEKTATITVYATAETIASNGARYRRYTHPFVAGGSEPYTSSFFKDKDPVADGVIGTLSWNNSGSGPPSSYVTLPGHDPSTSFDASDAAILVNGFFFAGETGTYTFRSDGESIDDWGYLWVGDVAYKADIGGP
ncbi:hypothetical protein ACJ41O_011801 [Fusarium nematophilum]